MNGYIAQLDTYPYSKVKRTFSVAAAGLLVIRFVQIVIAYALRDTVGELFPDFASGSYFRWFINYVPFYFVAIPVYVLLMSYFPKAERKRISPLCFFDWIKLLASSYALIYAGNVIGVTVGRVLSRALGKDVTNPVAEALDSENVFLMLLIVGVLAPIFEEIVFRKTMIDRLSLYGEKNAMIFTGVCFGLFHGNIAQGFYAAFLGIFFGYVYLRTGKIRYTVALHMFINSVSVIQSHFMPDLDRLSDILYSEEFSGTKELIKRWLSDNALGLSVVIPLLIGCATLGIFGLVTLIRHKKYVYFNRAPLDIPKGKTGKIMWFNAGTVLFLLYCGFEIVYSIVG